MGELSGDDERVRRERRREEESGRNWVEGERMLEGKKGDGDR